MLAFIGLLFASILAIGIGISYFFGDAYKWQQQTSSNGLRR